MEGQKLATDLQFHCRTSYDRPDQKSGQSKYHRLSEHTIPSFTVC